MKEAPILLAAVTIGLVVMFFVNTNQQIATVQSPTPEPDLPPSVQRIALPTPALAPTVIPRRPAPVAVAEGNLAAFILETAQSWLGVRYRWGGCTTGGVDCSCFVQNVFRAAGISVPRTTKPQFVTGVAVAREDVQLGDMVFFNNTCSGCGPNPTHVGLAISNTLMIHCGDPCTVAPISIFPYYAGARRVF